MKILLSAYSCLPLTGSEPGVGWNWANCIAALGHEVVVLTRTLGRPSIEEHRRNHPKPSIRFAYYDLARPWALLYKIPLGNYAYYILWQYSAAKWAVGLHRTEQFDQVQHITWGSLRVPSFMGSLGIPFIFGPVGGGEVTPRRLRRGLGLAGGLWDLVRRFSIAMMTPALRPTCAAASQIVTTTQETLEALPRAHRHKAWSRPAVGIDPELVLPDRDKALAQESGRLNLLFVGRLLPWKGVHLALKALAELGADAEQIHLTVIGSGSDSARLRHMADRLKVNDKVTWMGWRSHEEVIGLYARFDLFVFPSLHESGGMAVLEAMSSGLPVLCLDIGGPAQVVNDFCGRVIRTRGCDEASVVTSMAAFLRAMMADRTALARLSDAARARAVSSTWQSNVDAVYKKMLVPAVHSIKGEGCA